MTDVTKDLLGAQTTVDAQTVDRAWARFCGAFGDGPDAPYPGMIAAFETHYGQSFRDKEWRTEAACWAAAWSKAVMVAHPQAEPVRLTEMDAVEIGAKFSTPLQFGREFSEEGFKNAFRAIETAVLRKQGFKVEG